MSSIAPLHNALPQRPIQLESPTMSGQARMLQIVPEIDTANISCEQVTAHDMSSFLNMDQLDDGRDASATLELRTSHPGQPATSALKTAPDAAEASIPQKRSTLGGFSSTRNMIPDSTASDPIPPSTCGSTSSTIPALTANFIPPTADIDPSTYDIEDELQLVTQPSLKRKADLDMSDSTDSQSSEINPNTYAALGTTICSDTTAAIDEEHADTIAESSATPPLKKQKTTSMTVLPVSAPRSQTAHQGDEDGDADECDIEDRQPIEPNTQNDTTLESKDTKKASTQSVAKKARKPSLASLQRHSCLNRFIRLDKHVNAGGKKRRMKDRFEYIRHAKGDWVQKPNKSKTTGETKTVWKKMSPSMLKALDELVENSAELA